MVGFVAGVAATAGIAKLVIDTIDREARDDIARALSPPE